MTQVLAGVLFLVVGSWLASWFFRTAEGEYGLIRVIALATGSVGVSYLTLARRVGKLQRDRGITYYWQRQPGIVHFEFMDTYAVPPDALTR
jgi:hypothetical protein